MQSTTTHHTENVLMEAFVSKHHQSQNNDVVEHGVLVERPRADIEGVERLRHERGNTSTPAHKQSSATKSYLVNILNIAEKDDLISHIRWLLYACHFTATCCNFFMIFHERDTRTRPATPISKPTPPAKQPNKQAAINLLNDAHIVHDMDKCRHDYVKGVCGVAQEKWESMERKRKVPSSGTWRAPSSSWFRLAARSGGS